MNELLEKSSGRSDQNVLWIAVHTAEGAYDDDPADPAEDPGSADNLLNYFKTPGVRASSHAIADDDELKVGLIPYDRASWTLRGGNSDSDNIELCGRAGWSRAVWLTHTGMLENCARWIASRCKARAIPVEYIGTAGVAARRKGVIGHVNYTDATNDGTHWDPGPGFPWDYVIKRAKALTEGSAAPQTKETFMALTDAEQAELLTISRETVRAARVQGALLTSVATRLVQVQQAGLAEAAEDDQEFTALLAENAASEARLTALIEAQDNPEVPAP